MIKDRIARFTKGVVNGYLRVFKSAGALVLTLLAVGGVSAIIVTPLWLLATRHGELYTIISVCGLAVALLTPLVIRLIKDPARRRVFLGRLLRSLSFVVLAALLYFIVLLYAWNFYGAAVPLTIIFIVATGLIFHGKSIAKG